MTDENRITQHNSELRRGKKEYISGLVQKGQNLYRKKKYKHKFLNETWQMQNRSIRNLNFIALEHFSIASTTQTENLLYP